MDTANRIHNLKQSLDSGMINKRQYINKLDKLIQPIIRVIVECDNLDSIGMVMDDHNMLDQAIRGA